MLALGFLMVVWAEEGRAEVAVKRDHDEIQVSVENDTVGRVLEALAQNGDLRYRSKGSLDKVIGGSFSGSWGEVLPGILAGFDFVVAYRPQGVEIVIFGESGATPGGLPPTETSPQPQTPSPQPQPASPQPQPASPAAEKGGRGAALAPRRSLPSAPSEYDLATSNLMRH